jgi:deoxynucleotidyltransferase terminal-interacting protein 1
MDQNKIPEIRIYSPVQDTTEERTCSESDLRRKVFDMRTVNLSNFPLTSSAYKLSHYRSHQNNLMTRAKSHVTLNPVKSLNLLRQALQKSVNQELDQVIRKYLNIFSPAIRNIRDNSGDNSVSEYHVQAVCRQMLEEAKKMYFTGNGQSSHGAGSNLSASPSMPLSELSDSESVNHNHCKKRVKGEAESDDSDREQTENVTKIRRGVKKMRKKMLPDAGNRLHWKSDGISAENAGRSGFRWDPDRLTEDTKFVLGSRANKALGFGMTRGRLYTKHADLFRYIGDMEDKQWLSEHKLMPTSGGRAYLLIMQDIDDLLRSPDYCGMPGVDPAEMGAGFTVPKKMINKMKALMQANRSSSSSFKANTSENQETDSRPESSIGKRDEVDDNDGRSLTGDEISNILPLNSADVPSTVPSPASSSKAFSPAVDDSPLVMEPFL